MITQLDKKIIRLLSRDIPLHGEPFKALAGQLKMSEKKLLGRVKFYKDNGFMRKYTAVLDHRKVGFSYNAMVVWKIPRRNAVKAGKIMAGFPEVTHCYERKTGPGWGYNLYAMVHSKNRKDCLSVVREIAGKVGGAEHRLLFSTKEYKKTGVKY